jgi:hypothetical protein
VIAYHPVTDRHESPGYFRNYGQSVYNAVTEQQ